MASQDDRNQERPPHTHLNSQPQFPQTREGQLARVFKQEKLDSMREERARATAERIEKAAQRLEQALDKARPLIELAAKGAADADYIAAAVKGATEAFIHQVVQLRMPIEVEPIAADRDPEDFPEEEHHWDIPAWNLGYRSFRAHVVGLHEPNQSKIALAGLNGFHERTLNRAMVYYHLNVRLWPPELWPERMPPRPRAKLKKLVKKTTGPLAAIFFGYVLLDASDGKLDGLVHLCRVFVHQFVATRMTL